jgi:hypothetical protein
MGRVLAGIACALLLISGTVLMWRGSAKQPGLPPAPAPRLAASVVPSSPVTMAPIGEAPSADPKSKEEKRFARADKNDDGRITLAELVEPRRMAYAKLDLNQDGKLSFEEWAVKTIDKYKDANYDGDGWLSAAEYAATAPKPKAKKPACACA